MYNLFNFYLFIYWLCLSIFIINFHNLIVLLLLTELFWLIIYFLFICLSVLLNNLILFSFTLFILSFATLEFAINFSILIIFYIYF